MGKSLTLLRGQETCYWAYERATRANECILHVRLRNETFEVRKNTLKSCELKKNTTPAPPRLTGKHPRGHQHPPVYCLPRLTLGERVSQVQPVDGQVLMTSWMLVDDTLAVQRSAAGTT